MKRLFGTIIAITALGMFYSKAIETQELHTIQYANVGPLAAMNFATYLLHAVESNSNNHSMLETTRAIAHDPARLQKWVGTYKKSAPQKLQIMKRDICQRVGLDHTSVLMKKECTVEGVSTFSSFKTIIINKSFLSEPRNQQLGVLAHEIGHIINDDCTGQVVSDTAINYATSVAQYVATFALHMPSDETLQNYVAQYPQAALSQALEFRADTATLHVPGAAQGLIEYFESQSAQDPNYDTAHTALNSHPTYKERIARLQQYVQQGK